MGITRRNYLNVARDARRRIEDNTPANNFNSQGITKAFVDILSLEMEKLYDDAEFIYNSIDPTKATGSDLDKIGFLVGERRKSGVTASDYSNTNFYFYIDPNLNWNIKTLIKRNYSIQEQDILIENGYLTVDSYNEPVSLIIPQGTRITNRDKTIVYTTIADASLSNRNDTYVGVLSSSIGPNNNVESNVLISHSLIEIPELRKIAHYIKCSNRFPIQNGSYSYTDEEFRYNISTARSAIRTNELSIKRAALSVPGIRDILFEKNKFGNGTVSIIVEGISPLVSDGLVESVRQKVQQECPYGNVAFVSKPEYLGVEIKFNIVTEPGTTNSDFLRNSARDTVINYINNLPIGGEIIWNEIINRVMDIEGIIDFIPEYFKYGEYDSFNKINKNQIVLRFINQRPKYNQKWYCDKALIHACI